MSKKKEINESVLNQIKGIEENISNIEKTKEEDFISNEKWVYYTFSLTESQTEAIRKILYFMRFEYEKKDFNYNQSDIFREGIALLKEKYKDISPRPKEFKVMTNRGRKKGEKNNEVQRYYTSFKCLYSDQNFIYDLIFSKEKEGKEYRKEDVLTEIIEAFEEKCGKKFR